MRWVPVVSRGEVWVTCSWNAGMFWQTFVNCVRFAHWDFILNTPDPGLKCETLRSDEKLYCRGGTKATAQFAFEISTVRIASGTSGRLQGTGLHLNNWLSANQSGIKQVTDVTEYPNLGIVEASVQLLIAGIGKTLCFIWQYLDLPVSRDR